MALTLSTNIKMDSQPYVLTKMDETGNDPIIVLRSHIFYQPKPSDIKLNLATVEANWNRMVDVTAQLGWGENTVWVLTS